MFLPRGFVEIFFVSHTINIFDYTRLQAGFFIYSVDKNHIFYKIRYMADYNRQDRFYEFLQQEPLRSKLLQYADEHGITGDTYGGSAETRERFKLMEAYDRVCAEKVCRFLRTEWMNASLESTLDGYFLTGGTWADVEIKARHYDYDYTDDWALEPEKVMQLEAVGGWFMCIWPDRDNPLNFHYALWDVSDSPRGSMPIRCKKSVAIQDTGAKQKDFPTFNINYAEHKGYISTKVKYDYIKG